MPCSRSGECFLDPQSLGDTRAHASNLIYGAERPRGGRPRTAPDRGRIVIRLKHIKKFGQVRKEKDSWRTAIECFGVLVRPDSINETTGRVNPASEAARI